MIWFTSDEHIGHRNIIEFCKRPFVDLTDMHIMLIDNHNKYVKDGDFVYHIGDMFWRTYDESDALEYMSKLNGSHIYVHGNHDELIRSSSNLRSCFSSVTERLHIHPEGAPKFGIALDHYAGRVWQHSAKGSWQLYGHSHAELPEIDPLLAMDVGVDANNWFPVSLDEVMVKMNKKTKRIMRSLGVGPK